jgi:hypothetical protein
VGQQRGGEFPLPDLPGLGWDGNYILSGDVDQIACPFGRLFLLAKLESLTGALMWQNGYAELNGNVFNVNVETSATRTIDGGWVLAGTSNAFSTGMYSFYGAWMLKVDSSGADIIWQKLQSDDVIQYGSAQYNTVVETAEGDLAAAGQMDAGSSGIPEFLLAQADARRE